MNVLGTRAQLRGCELGGEFAELQLKVELL